MGGKGNRSKLKGFSRKEKKHMCNEPLYIFLHIGGSTGQLNQQPRINLPRHVDVVSSDDTQPSWSGIQHTQVHNSNGQASSSGVYSGPPGSNNVGSLGRSVMRRLHDSGFSPDASRGDHRWTGKYLWIFIS